VLYAPGAGSNLHDPFGRFLAQHLAQAGIPSLRFQFPYQETGGGRPDRPPVLEAAWTAALEAAAARGCRLVLTGRSMGGRIASMVAAKGTPAAALGLFAYPLHPPGQPEKRRDGHLGAIALPTLFCSGTRDAFGTPEELAAAAALVPDATVHLLDGADHGFAVLKSSGRTQRDVWVDAAGALTGWLAGLA
jgi:predicted alpha/beta-hydrolase family hydrolase